MIWLTWRQFRTQALAALAVLAAVAVYVLITGTQMRHTYTADLACHTPQTQCGLLLDQLQRTYNGPRQFLGLLLLTLPALIGIFWGAPLVSAEFERSTHRMTWNQSITPTRWLTVKFALIGLATLLTAGLFSLAITWWASPIDQIPNDRFSALTFATRNIAPVGYAAFAFTLGVTLGLFVRRSLLAMALVLAVVIPVQVVFASQIRGSLLPSTSATMVINGHTLNDSRAGGIAVGGNFNGPISLFGLGPTGSWIQSQTNAENRAGREISANEVNSCLNAGPTGSLTSIGDCLAPYDLHVDYTYQPASNYWPLQWYETGIYLALASLLAGACFWRIRRHRD